ncbi:class I SAM-dependent methyltransferase [Nocardia veterana]|nr:class I SAM-dependent methyltransferase [Nocardia veterana]
MSGARTEEVAAAYDGVAELYQDMFRDAIVTQPYDRAVLGLFAELVRTERLAPVADLGCGPGRLTGFLRDSGLDVFGLDASAEMIRLARIAHPDLRFQHGSMTRIDMADGALGAIVAWYSIIHMPPERLPDVFTEFARALTDNGLLLLGFLATDEGIEMQSYDHKVAPAVRWSPARLIELLRPYGFVPLMRMVREPEPDERCPQGYLLVRKSATPVRSDAEGADS